MKTLVRLLAAVLVVMALGGAARLTLAQDEPAPPRSEDSDSDTRVPADEEDDVFIPTEEIPADEEITFPVNI